MKNIYSIQMKNTNLILNLSTFNCKEKSKQHRMISNKYYKLAFKNSFVKCDYIGFNEKGVTDFANYLANQNNDIVDKFTAYLNRQDEEE